MRRHRGNLNDLNLRLFNGLDANTLNQWNDIHSVCTLDAGEHLYSEGELAKFFYIIVSGGVRLVENTPAGKAVTVKVYGIGDMMGLLSLTEEYNHVSSLVAVKPTTIVSFRSDEARKLLTENGLMAMRFVDCLIRHVHHAHDRIRNLATEKTERRLARALLHFHRKFGYVHNDIHVISAELSQRDISEFTGTTLETVNRYLRTWEKSGWIKLSYRHIDILKPDHLENIAASVSQYGYMPE